MLDAEERRPRRRPTRRRATSSRRRPQDARAHFALAYVLRYAGLLEEAARECDEARRGDPGSRNLRSCGVVYMWMNDDAKALDYYRLDAGSEYQKRWDALLRLRRGDPEPIRKLAASPSFGDSGNHLLESRRASATVPWRRRSRSACETAIPRAATRTPASSPAPDIRRQRFASSARPSREIISRARRWTHDPLFDSIRKTPEFAAIRAEAIRKQKEFWQNAERRHPEI